MFSLKDATNYITLKSILDKVSEYNIWKRYCRNFEEIDKSFCSELYNDRNAGCRIRQCPDNVLVYKDFGTGQSYNWYSYIMVKYGCTYNEALRIVYNDFKLGSIKYDILPQLVLNDAPEVKRIARKAFIEIVDQPFTIFDYNYWSKYEIPLQLLEEYNVFSCKIVYLHTKDGRTITFEYRDDNPIYAYRFCNEGRYSYKVYFPLSRDKKHKWLFSGGSNLDIEGIDNLPYFEDILILTKSLKDCMVYNLIGYPAISLQGEANKLSKDLVDKLLKRFNYIIINYDNDEQGIKSTNSLIRLYGFKHFYVEGEKDLSDFVEIYGLEQAKIMIDNKIKEING